MKRLSPLSIVIAVIAVVALSAGTSVAAGRYLITSTKQISPKVIKKLSGKSGPMGPAGPVGAKGDAGAKGETGATGPAGAPGVAGVKGDTGPAGPAGVMGYQVVDASLTLDSTSLGGAVSATCPAGKQVIGGGAGVSSGTNLVLTDSAWASSILGEHNMWRVEYTTTNGAAIGVVGKSIYATAICAKVN